MDVWGNEDMEQEHCSTCRAPVWQNVHGEIDYIRTAPKVKPLVWERDDDGSLTAESVFGLYAVYVDGGHGLLVILDGSDDSWAKYPEEDFGFEREVDAVTACNKDYERRILSALE